MTTTAPAVPITPEQFKVARHKRRQARPTELGWSTWLAISTVCSCRHISLSIKRKWRLSDCTGINLAWIWQTRFWRLRPYFPVSWRFWQIMCFIDDFNRNWSTCPVSFSYRTTILSKPEQGRIWFPVEIPRIMENRFHERCGVLPTQPLHWWWSRQ